MRFYMRFPKIARRHNVFNIIDHLKQNIVTVEQDMLKLHVILVRYPIFDNQISSYASIQDLKEFEGQWY